MSLSVQKLSFSYGERPVLEDISFSLEKGEFLSVLGPNGVGKSTLFRCILGLLPGYQGRILSDGEDMRGLSRREMSRRIAYIPQINRPSFGYSVLDTRLTGSAQRSWRSATSRISPAASSSWCWWPARLRSRPASW